VACIRLTGSRVQVSLIRATHAVFTFSMSAYFTHSTCTEDQRPVRTGDRPVRCPGLVGFLAICAGDPAGTTFRLPPCLTTSYQGSFHFRKVRMSTSSPELRRALPTDREFIAVKHPVVCDEAGVRRTDLYSDIATEL
jgi:hypothetical protein